MIVRSPGQRSRSHHKVQSQTLLTDFKQKSWRQTIQHGECCLTSSKWRALLIFKSGNPSLKKTMVNILWLTLSRTLPNHFNQIVYDICPFARGCSALCCLRPMISQSLGYIRFGGGGGGNARQFTSCKHNWHTLVNSWDHDILYD